MINGAGGRRRWSADEKAGIVAETLEPGAVVSEVARRHGLTPQQVFTWRREARLATEAGVAEGDDRPAFVPAVLEATSPEPTKPGDRRARAPRAGRGAVPIELEIDGVVVRIGRGADAATVAAVAASRARGDRAGRSGGERAGRGSGAGRTGDARGGAKSAGAAFFRRPLRRLKTPHQPARGSGPREERGSVPADA
ncbi:IS66-like element accessory protein TnpA [Salinarimonas rosea]|uniref:IS66-like element accessory protein TnpA n=1 Tax=Salinarimonas rosea TaxID=552063 RepID=UPI003CC9180E